MPFSYLVLFEFCFLRCSYFFSVFILFSFSLVSFLVLVFCHCHCNYAIPLFIVSCCYFLFSLYSFSFSCSFYSLLFSKLFVLVFSHFYSLLTLLLILLLRSIAAKPKTLETLLKFCSFRFHLIQLWTWNCSLFLIWNINCLFLSFSIAS